MYNDKPVLCYDVIVTLNMQQSCAVLYIKYSHQNTSGCTAIIIRHSATNDNESNYNTTVK